MTIFVHLIDICEKEKTIFLSWLRNLVVIINHSQDPFMFSSPENFYTSPNPDVKSSVQHQYIKSSCWHFYQCKPCLKKGRSALPPYPRTWSNAASKRLSKSKPKAFALLYKSEDGPWHLHQRKWTKVRCLRHRVCLDITLLDQTCNCFSKFSKHHLALPVHACTKPSTL